MRTIGVVVAVLALPLLAQAQTKAELGVIDAWLLGGTANDQQREAAVVQLLRSKPALARGSKDGHPLLAYALDNASVTGDIGRRSRKLAELLIAKGADVNLKIDKAPLVVKYATFARIDPMLILLAKGADPNAVDADGRTGLHWLATLGETGKDPSQIQQAIKAAAALVDHKAKIDARDKWGKTPLHVAAFIGSKKMTESLLARGADLNAKDGKGYTVLGACRLRVEEGPNKPTFANAKEKEATREVIKLLVAKGAKDERPK